MKKHCIGKCKFSKRNTQLKMQMCDNPLKNDCRDLVSGAYVYTAGGLPNACNTL